MTEYPPLDPGPSPQHKVHEFDPSAQRPDSTPTGYREPDAGATPDPDGYQPANPAFYPDHGPLRAGTALDYGWETVKSNPATWLGVGLAGFALYGVFVAIVWLFRPSSMFPVLLLMIAGSIASLLFQTCLVRGALYELDGRRPRAGAFVQQVNMLGVLTTAGIVLALTVLGYLLFVIPAVIVVFLSMFALHFVIDHRLDPVDAIRSSWRLVLANIVPLLLLLLINGVLLTLGLLSCGIGLLAAVPIAAISVTFAYRSLTYGAIAPMWA